MPQPTDKAVLDKLDTILKVLALEVGSDKSVTERARLLKMAGMDNKTIANVLNTTALEKVAQLSLSGLSNLEIADLLGTSSGVVATYVSAARRGNTRRKKS